MTLTQYLFKNSLPVHVEERIEPRLVVALDGDPTPLLQDAAEVGRGQPRPVVQGQGALDGLHDPQLVRKTPGAEAE